MFGLGPWENLNVKNQTLHKLMEEYLNSLKMGYIGLLEKAWCIFSYVFHCKNESWVFQQSNREIHKYDKKVSYIKDEIGQFYYFKI